MIQEIKDRVPINVLSNDAIRYGIYDEQGNLLRYEYIKREDEPIEIGTPINRALFSNIQGDLYTADRYNEPVVTVEEHMVSEVSTTNIFTPNGWTLVTNYTEYTRNGYELKASSSYNYETAATHAFSGNLYWASATNGESSVQIKLDSAKKITKMYGRISSLTANSENNFDIVFNGAKIQGSFTGDEWIDLYEITEAQTTAVEMKLSNSDFYLYYRIYFNELTTAGYNAMVQSWATLEWEEMIPKTFYTNNLSLPLKSYEVGKIVNIGNPEIEALDRNCAGTNYFQQGFVEKSSQRGIFADGTILEITNTGDKELNNIFDNDKGTYVGIALSSTSGYGYAKIDCVYPIKATEMYLRTNLNVNVVIKGSHNNEQWVELYNATHSTAENTVNLANADFYEHYKLECTASDGGVVLLYAWEITSYYGKIVNYLVNPYLNINNLGAKQINGTIVAGEKYNLVYNGESWDIYQPSKIVTGSYTGAGAFGSSYPNIIDLGFKPKFVCIRALSDHLFYFCEGNRNYMFNPSQGSYVYDVDYEKGIKWYSTADAKSQMNASGEIYDYIAFA